MTSTFLVSFPVFSNPFLKQSVFWLRNSKNLQKDSDMGVPRNMTVDELFRMSSSKYWISFKDFLQLSLVEKSFTPINILIWNLFYYNKTAIKCLLLFSLVSNNLANYGRRHFKIFSNCHVSWDTLYYKIVYSIRLLLKLY